MIKAGTWKIKTNTLKNFWWSLAVSACLVGCQGEPIKLEGVEIKVWIDDAEGCNLKRATMVPVILEQKEKILAHSEADIIELLGKPDRVELYTRNQKLYHYRISPGPTCSTPDSLNSELLIRFNAMGRAKEMYSTPE